MKPLAIDLFCGMFGWSEGLIAEGWRTVGFDLEDMRGQFGFPRLRDTQLVIQNVLSLHGSQFRNADLIVASPPCQAYSWMAMPWKKAKAKAAAIRADDTGAELERLNRLFNACFRIQMEASLAAGRHIPMIVENVKGAQPWVGRARWLFGSFALWGDVPALMPITSRAIKVPTMGAGWYPPDHPKHVKGLGFNTHAERHIKNAGGSWFNVAHNTTSGRGANPTRDPMWLRGFTATAADRIKQGGDWLNQSQPSISRMTSSKSPARKMASAMIAKIPELLSRHIARTFYPRNHNVIQG